MEQTLGTLIFAVVAIFVLVAAAGCGQQPVRSEPLMVVAASVAPAESRPEPETPDLSAVTVPEPPQEETVEVAATVPGEDVYPAAERAYRAGRYDEAFELFGRHTEQHPTQGWGYYMLGLAAWKSGRMDSAEIAFEYAVELDPRHTRSFINLSRVLLEIGDAERALDRIERVLELEPDSSVGYRLRGDAYQMLDRKGEAERDYRRALELNRYDVWAMDGIGRLRLGRGEAEAALLPLGRAVQLRPDVAELRNDLGLAMEAGGYFRSARRQYLQGLELDSDNPKIADNLERVETMEENPIRPLVLIRELGEDFEAERAHWTAESTVQEPPALQESPIEVTQSLDTSSPN